jgi:hypothetical protein
MSRGDYIEYLLREKAGLIDEALAAAAIAQAQQAQTSFAPPAIEQETTYVPPVHQPAPIDWSNQ